MRQLVLFQFLLRQTRRRQLRRQHRRLIFHGEKFILIPRHHAAHGSQFQKAHGPVDGLLLLHQDFVNLRLLRLFFERHQLLLQKRHHVLHALHILRRLFQLAKAFRFPHAVQTDARHVLENQPPLLRPRRQDLIHPVLPDDGQRPLPEPRGRQELLDILQAAASLIQLEITVPIPKQPARDRHLRRIQRQLMSRIIQDQRHLGTILLRPRLGAGENNILRLLPANIPHILLPQDPAHRIGNITLPAAIGPHDHRHALRKIYSRLVRKGFESRQRHSE